MRVIMRDGRCVIVADAAATAPAAGSAGGDEIGTRFTAIGYRQTTKSAVDGGKANTNGFRFVPSALAAIASSYTNRPFVTAHDWGDVRARGGTITAARVEDVASSDEQAIHFDIEAMAPWAIEGLANGTIDRFSVGIEGQGEITCTAHGTPVFDTCYCFPGELVTIAGKAKGSEREVIAEWEFAGGIGLELSAVNVPAVDGTGIVDNVAAPMQRRELLTALSTMCGRRHPDLMVASLPSPGTPPPVIAAAAPALDPRVAQLEAELAAARTHAAQLEAEGTATHVNHEIERITRHFDVSAVSVDKLREIAAARGRAAFDESLALVEATAHVAGARAPSRRGTLQSDAHPAAAPGDPNVHESDGNDAYALTMDNPNMPALMRACKVTAADVRKHGARQFVVVPDLAELAANTSIRGERMGTGK